MMGVNMGYQPGPRQSIFKRYAWIPVRTTSNKWVWFNDFYVIQTHYDENGKPPIKTLFWKTTLNKNEWLLEQIKNPKKDPTPPVSGKPRMYYYKK
jgi:hypothetical protein